MPKAGLFEDIQRLITLWTESMTGIPRSVRFNTNKRSLPPVLPPVYTLFPRSLAGR